MVKGLTLPAVVLASLSLAACAAVAQGGQDYATCSSTRLEGQDPAALKDALIDAIGDVAEADGQRRFFADNLVLAAPAGLHGGGGTTIVYTQGPRLCGSGGCDAYILKQDNEGGFALVTKMLPARLPIMVLPESSKGWHDIGMTVAGGGITEAYVGRLSFDGETYASNATLDDVAHVDRGAGKIVLGEAGAASGQCRLR